MTKAEATLKAIGMNIVDPKLKPDPYKNDNILVHNTLRDNTMDMAMVRAGMLKLNSQC